MLVYFALGDANFSRFYPKRKPKSCQWNIGCVGCQRNIFASSMYISCFLVRFHLRRAPNANPFFVEYGLYIKKDLTSKKKDFTSKTAQKMACDSHPEGPVLPCEKKACSDLLK